ncbi:MAG: M64 family metallopeptidase [Planctomycetota bacterium]
MSRRAIQMLTLVMACGLALSALPVDDEEAQKIWDEAQELSRRGNYPKARRLYEELSEKYPGFEHRDAVALYLKEENPLLAMETVLESGDPANRVDVFITGDGYLYEPRAQKAMVSGAERVTKAFFRNPTYREYQSYFNFHRMNVASEENGVDGNGRDYNTAFNARSSGGAQGQVTVDRGTVQQYLRASSANDGLAIVLVRMGSLGTGGGGVAVVGGENAGTIIHEMGHAFARLSDEYSSDTGDRGVPRDGINISNSPEPDDLPWKHFVEAKIPGVSAFEGADGRAKGAWKPTAKGCAMDGSGDYCCVCRESVLLSIYAMVDPIDEVAVEEGQVEIPEGEEKEFQVTVLKPASHDLQVTWYLAPFDTTGGGDVLPEPEVVGAARGWRRSPRIARREMPPLLGEPEEGKSKRTRDGRVEHTFTVEDLDPGNYRLVVRVVDDARPKGEPFPWVIEDEHKLLESRRAWTIRVQ